MFEYIIQIKYLSDSLFIYVFILCLREAGTNIDFYFSCSFYLKKIIQEVRSYAWAQMWKMTKEPVLTLYLYFYSVLNVKEPESSVDQIRLQYWSSVTILLLH